MIDASSAAPGVVRRRIPRRRADEVREWCRVVSRMQSVLYREFGGAAAGPLAKLDAEVFAFVAFQCGAGSMNELGDDGHAWVALSAPHAARTMTKILGRPVSHKQARDSLARLRGRGALLAERRRFRGHGTNWFRPELGFLIFISALVGPVQGRCRAGEGPTRSVSSLAPTKKTPPHPPLRGGSQEQDPVGTGPAPRKRGLSPRALGTSPRQLAEAGRRAREEAREAKRRRRRAEFLALDPDPDPYANRPEEEYDEAVHKAWLDRNWFGWYRADDPSQRGYTQLTASDRAAMQKTINAFMEGKPPDWWPPLWEGGHWIWIKRRFEELGLPARSLEALDRRFVALPRAPRA